MKSEPIMSQAWQRTLTFFMSIGDAFARLLSHVIKNILNNYFLFSVLSKPPKILRKYSCIQKLCKRNSMKTCRQSM